MATSKSVIVCVPNGHRQTVQIAPNTTILQVLEEVCEKHGYNVNKYDLKHHNNVMDENAIVRFSGLVNNAQLQMVARSTLRSTSPVVIGIQLENGKRPTGEFMPDTNLLEVLLTLCPDEDLLKGVVNYMQREVHGQEALESTTLKSLGISSGKAMLRFLYKTPSQSKTQAHVTTPLASKSNAKSGTSHNRRQNNSTISQYLKNKVLDPIAMLREKKASMQESRISASVEKAEEPHEVNDKAENETEKNTEVTEETVKTETEASTSNPDDSNKSKIQAVVSQETDDGGVPLKIEFLGSRSALVFNQARIKSIPRDELPDDFFDLTINDAKVLLRDAKRRKEELEEAPLQTRAQRELQQETQKLQQLHKYRHAVIRIQFPDQFILQGLFGPLETVQNIREFIKDYLIDPDSDFTIYTTPPKYILKPEARLIDEKLVPSALIYYSGSSSLKEDIKNKLTDPKDAILQTAKIRQQGIRNNGGEKDSSEANKGGSWSSSLSSTTVPKWFSKFQKK